MDIRDLSTLDRTTTWLDELLKACQKGGGVYATSPALTANVVRKAKALKTALQSLRDAPLKPKQAEAVPEPRKGKKKLLWHRLAFSAPHIDLVKVLGYQGIPDPDFWPHYNALCDRFGQARVSEALGELVFFERHPRDGPAQARIKPEVVKLCRGLLGPAPE